MKDYIKDPHAAIFTGPTGCWKGCLNLDWIKKNTTVTLTASSLSAQSSDRTIHIISRLDQTDDNVWLIEPKDKLYQWIEKFSLLLTLSEPLFIIHDIIVDQSFDKRKQTLLEFTISGRHRNHYLWLLTQSYSAILMNLRGKSRAVFVCHQKKGQTLRRYMIKTMF